MFPNFLLTQIKLCAKCFFCSPSWVLSLATSRVLNERCYPACLGVGWCLRVAVKGQDGRSKVRFHSDVLFLDGSILDQPDAMSASQTCLTEAGILLLGSRLSYCAR